VLPLMIGRLLQKLLIVPSIVNNLCLVVLFLERVKGVFLLVINNPCNQSSFEAIKPWMYAESVFIQSVHLIPFELRALFNASID